MPSTDLPETPETSASNDVVSKESLRFDYPGSDIILRSSDSHDFRVPKLYLVNCSPVLRKLIRTVSNASRIADDEVKDAFLVVKLPESGAILHSLLTFIFPVAHVLPSTTENVMMLLAVAQKYRMDSVLTHVRGVISLQDPPFILPETSLHIYFLAQKHELRKEALLAARSTLRLSMTIEDMGDKVGFMPGAYLRELWEYHERVGMDLAASLLEFRKSGAPDILKDLHCGTPPSSSITPIPKWLDDYIESLARSPHSFDLIEFENALANHIKEQGSTLGSTACPCVGLSSQTIRAFWVALTAVVHGTIDRADSTLAIVKEGLTSESLDPPPFPLCSDLADANVILRSSDRVNFRVRKSVLAMSSPFFEDLLSLPQPLDGELVDGLPVVQLPEDSGLLNSLISLLYPIAPIIPDSYEKVFALLGACQKYDMVSIQSYVRSEVKRGTFTVPVGAEAFHAYAIASSMRLIPEMESAARLTLGHPMTFQSLGEGLRSFEGWALCDLVRYRRRCRDNLVSSLDSFFDMRSRFQIWAGCREPTPNSNPVNVRVAPTVWLRDFFSSKSAELQNGFTHAICLPSTILEEYIAALKNHNTSPYYGICTSCCHVQATEGVTFCRELEDQLTHALNEVSVSCTRDSRQRS